MTHFVTSEAAEALSGMLTAISLIWGLQSLILWRAVERGSIAPRLSLMLATQTLIAFAALSAAVYGLHLTAVGSNNVRLDVAYYAALAGMAALAGLVTVYYLIILAALHRAE